MGPEAALVSARLAAQGGGRVLDGYGEKVRDSMYVQVSVRSKLDEFLGPGHTPARPGVWARVGAALHLPAARARKRAEREADEAARLIEAAPAVALRDLVGRAAEIKEGEVTLAALPVYCVPDA